MSTWTPELKEKVKEMYLEGNPTPENSTELCKQIADEIEQSPNGVRMVLSQLGVYVKKDASASGRNLNNSYSINALSICSISNILYNFKGLFVKWTFTGSLPAVKSQGFLMFLLNTIFFRSE